MTYQSHSIFGIELHRTTTNKVTERDYVIKVHNGSKASKFVMKQPLQCIIRKVNCESEKASVSLSGLSFKVRRMLKRAM